MMKRAMRWLKTPQGVGWATVVIGGPIIGYALYLAVFWWLPWWLQVLLAVALGWFVVGGLALHFRDLRTAELQRQAEAERLEQGMQRWLDGL